MSRIAHLTCDYRRIYTMCCHVDVNGRVGRCGGNAIEWKSQNGDEDVEETPINGADQCKLLRWVEQLQILRVYFHKVSRQCDGRRRRRGRKGGGGGGVFRLIVWVFWKEVTRGLSRWGWRLWSVTRMECHRLGGWSVPRWLDGRWVILPCKWCSSLTTAVSCQVIAGECCTHDDERVKV